MKKYEVTYSNGKICFLEAINLRDLIIVFEIKFGRRSWVEKVENWKEIKNEINN